MWTQDADEAFWQAGLSASDPCEDACRCARFVLQIAAQCNEVFVGNDTLWLLQLLSAPSEDGREVDVIGTLLEPAEEGTRLCCTFRGLEAAKLLACFVERHPEAPALLQLKDGRFEYVLCGADDEEWTKGPVTLERLRTLWGLAGRERIAFFLPAEPQEAQTPSRFEDRPPRAIAES